MARNMSFMLTTQQIIDETKTVTRRLGWRFLNVGDELWAVEKAMGFKKGEKINRLKKIRIIGKRYEPLQAIDKPDCIREGFPDMTPDDFVKMFCSHMNCEPEQQVTRIEFEYIPQGSLGKPQ